jgi:DUF4097 and DUF4098 domain-containing protein YvlB
MSKRILRRSEDMKTKNLVLLLAAVLLMVWSASADAMESGTFDQTYSLSAGGKVSLDNVNGDVTIEVWERDEVRVYAEKTASSLELLDGLVIEVDASAAAIDIDTVYPSSSRNHDSHEKGHHRREMKVEYTLTVPRSAVIDGVDLVNGSLVIDGVEGGVNAETVNGNISVRNAAGGFALSTVNGAVELYADRLTAGDRVDLESVNGTLDLYLASSVGADIEAESVNGRLSNDFGIDVHKGKYVGSDFSGSVGGGGSRVSMETVNGRIAVHSW